MKKSRIIQIVGLSNSGKTTLILDMIKIFTKQNLSVATIKSARNHTSVSSGKDSDMFLTQGAMSSTISFSNVTQITTTKKTTLSELIGDIQSLSEPDIILVEGFKGEEGYDKILVWSEKFKENIDLFNLTNLKLVYCQKDRYNTYSIALKKLEKSQSTVVLSDPFDVYSYIINNRIED
ncbi:MAG: molybdopterin-guanine dinucleotide biosynthesis protein B [Candidatus Heimdallarchaeota archaeon]|nr:molybdopterin-guanine dinucleotide biosynthesis protein B [Candidatus Heimdallarchaeota archaeon]MCK4254247.1 molybdopterin-guanine dinucleotide biosynthesis protein B [Candidatus Heimdallarchaeota archaeon]